jgi:hypothetical protein
VLQEYPNYRRPTDKNCKQLHEYATEVTKSKFRHFGLTKYGERRTEHLRTSTANDILVTLLCVRVDGLHVALV